MVPGGSGVDAPSMLNHQRRIETQSEREAKVLRLINAGLSNYATIALKGRIN